MLRTSTIFLVFCALWNTVPAHAEQQPITRAEGYKIIWQTLKRPTEDNNEPPFQDVQEGDTYYALLTYGKARGVLEDGAIFYPNEPLRMFDALLWLLRSRNVDSVQNITFQTIQSYANRFGLAYEKENPTLTTNDVVHMIDTLDTYLKQETHTVSFYSDGFAGRNTAFGEIFNPNELTAAHRTLPHNTLVRVQNTQNGKSVLVRINDRGPYIDGRNMDLSRAAFERIAHLSNGIVSGITFERLGHKDLVTPLQTTARCKRIRYRNRLGSTMLTPGIPRIVPVGTNVDLASQHKFAVLLMRAPGTNTVRSREWIEPSDSKMLRFDTIGNYLFVLQNEAGERRRYRTRVISECR